MGEISMWRVRSLAGLSTVHCGVHYGAILQSTSTRDLTFPIGEVIVSTRNGRDDSKQEDMERSRDDLRDG